MLHSLARRSLTAFLAAAAASCVTAAPSFADQWTRESAPLLAAPAGVNAIDVDAPGATDGAATLSFDDLATIRGRYAPEMDAGAIARTAIPDRAATDSLRVPAGLLTRATLDTATAPSLPAGGAIQAFDLTMGSTWQTSTGTTYTAGLDLGVTLGTNATTEHTWATVANGAEAPAPSGIGTIDFAKGGFNGVGQTIQITGNGNTVANHANVDIGSTPLAPFDTSAVAGTACTSACVVGIDAQGARLSIALPGGVVAQKLGADGISQTAQVHSDLNAIANSLQLHLQVAPQPAFNPAQVLPALLQGNVLR